MKRRRTKDSIRRVERLIAGQLKGFLPDSASGEIPASVNLALVTLTQLWVRLDYPTRARDWWVDDLEWSQVSSGPDKLNGTGKLWWGRRSQASGEMVETPFTFQLRLTRSGRSMRYQIAFSDRGVEFLLGSTDQKHRNLVTAPA